jgi:hypothetical protein
MPVMVFPEKLGGGRAVALMIRDSRLFTFPNKESRAKTVIQSRHSGISLDYHITNTSF